MIKVLIVTRDLSYPGGTEEFLKNFLLYCTEKYSKEIKVFLFETEGSGKFINKDIYLQFKRNNIKIFSSVFKENDFWNLKRMRELLDIISKYKIKIVHSALFNSDFTVLGVKLGKKKLIDEVNRILSIKDFKKIARSLFSEKKDLPRQSFKWISMKFSEFSVDLEKKEKKWEVRKRIIDEELEPIVTSYTDKLIAVSKSIKGKWSKWTNREISLIPCSSIGKLELDFINSIQRDKNYLRKKWDIPLNNRVFVWSGRLVPIKGVDILVKEFVRNLSNKNTLLIIGRGELEAEIIKYSNHYKEKIRFLGFLDRRSIMEILVAADVFCLPSLSEGLSLSLQEAMAAMKPILASRVGGILDLVEDGKNGYLFDVGDINSLINLLKWFSKASERDLKKMGSFSRKIIENNFLREKSYKKIISIYKSLNK